MSGPIHLLSDNPWPVNSHICQGRMEERRNDGTKGSFNSVGICKHAKGRARGADKSVIDRARRGINPPLMDLPVKHAQTCN